MHELGCFARRPRAAARAAACRPLPFVVVMESWHGGGRGGREGRGGRGDQHG